MYYCQFVCITVKYDLYIMGLPAGHLKYYFFSAYTSALYTRLILDISCTYNHALLEDEKLNM